MGTNCQTAGDAARLQGARRDRPPFEIAVNLSWHMPLLVRGIFLDDHKPTRSSPRPGTVEQFIADVRASLASTPHIDAQPAIHAVLDTLTHPVERGAFATIHHVLPPQLPPA